MNQTHALPSTEHIAWTGRTDGTGPAHARWHQLVTLGGTPEAARHITLAGFASDEGVRRNKGRVGASEGPAALRAALSSMAAHGEIGAGTVDLVDAGDIATHGEDLESAQAAMGQAIASALGARGNNLTVVLGGGHETAWASYLGLRTHLDAHRPGATWGVLNLDAHFDLRSAPTPTSGTPFLQMAEAERLEGRDLNYAVLGIARPGNTAELFDTADALGVTYRTDLECEEMGARGMRAFVEDFAAGVDALYLTIDLDVLPAHTAPGVSAPAALGVKLPLILAAVRAAAASGKLCLLDVVELNPRFDIDGRTAKAAARLIWDAAHEIAG